MLHFLIEVISMDNKKNDYVEDTAHAGRIKDRVREAAVRWFGHLMRRKNNYVGRKMTEMDSLHKRKRGRPKGRFVNWIEK